MYADFAIPEVADDAASGSAWSNMGLRILEGIPQAGSKKWEEGIAFLMSALEDAKEFLDGAPPDNWHMNSVGYWFVLLTMLLKEDLSSDLYELKDSLEKLKATDDFSKFLDNPPQKTYLRLAQQTAVKYYPFAIKEFSHVFETLYEAIGAKGIAIPHQENLAALLNDSTIENVSLYCPAENIGRGPKVSHENLTLYRCSWCGNPSALLRKCGRCKKTRYCDSACQKAHWSQQHKNTCRI